MKGKKPTRSKAEAELAAQRANKRATNLAKRGEEERKTWAAKVRNLRKAATGTGARNLAVGAAGGALAGALGGAVTAFSARYVGQPGALGSVAKYTSDPRTAGALAGVAGAALALMTDGKPGRGAAMAGQLGTAMAAGGAALATADIVRRAIPATVAAPAPVQGLRRLNYSGGLSREQMIRIAQLGAMPGPRALPGPQPVAELQRQQYGAARRY